MPSSEHANEAPVMYLAEFNIGTLRYDWDDPRIADFADNLGRIYTIAERSPGYVWHLSGEEMEAAQLDAQGVLGGIPRTASTLSVWETPEALAHFTWNTLHKQFFDRRGEWYAQDDQVWGGHRLVMWWVPKGHRPSIAEAAMALKQLMSCGDTEHAFGWDWLKNDASHNTTTHRMAVE